MLVIKKNLLLLILTNKNVFKLAAQRLIFFNKTNLRDKAFYKSKMFKLTSCWYLEQWNSFLHIFLSSKIFYTKFKAVFRRRSLKVAGRRAECWYTFRLDVCNIWPQTFATELFQLNDCVNLTWFTSPCRSNLFWFYFPPIL